ncbi:MAG: hypothetical protein IPM63_16470 [Acidobacteriota bacterium]|nr:MAG: hypothetical protein IPM63_16470 [Acidobacteriota bacterium]
MGKVLTFVLGLLIGGAAAYFLFVGVPAANEMPGEPVAAPSPGGPPPGTATVVLDEPFFQAVLQTIFEQMNAPEFPLRGSNGGLDRQDGSGSYASAQNAAPCNNTIKILREGSGVKTSVRLEKGKLVAPLAFEGNVNVLGNCARFSGWSKTGLSLTYDSEKRTVYGKIEVETVNLDGVTPLASGLVAQFVQSAINQRVNPITILKGEQVAVSLPIEASGGTLSAQISDVRAEIKEKTLNLLVTYDFKGSGTSEGK